MQEDSSKKILLSVLGVAILIVAVVGVSFAAFSYSKTGTKDNVITTGAITMSYTEPQNGINLTDALPITDTAGKALTGENNVFDFTVAATITGTTTINYAITATTTPATYLTDAFVKVYLTDNANATDAVFGASPKKVSTLTKTGASEASGAPQGQFILKTGTFTSSQTNNYRLRMWVSDDYTGNASGEIPQETYKLRVNVYGKAAAQ